MCLAIYRQDDFSVMDCVWYRKAASKWGMFTALELDVLTSFFFFTMPQILCRFQISGLF